MCYHMNILYKMIIMYEEKCVTLLLYEQNQYKCEKKKLKFEEMKNRLRNTFCLVSQAQIFISIRTNNTYLSLE